MKSIKHFILITSVFLFCLYLLHGCKEESQRGDQNQEVYKKALIDPLSSIIDKYRNEYYPEKDDKDTLFVLALFYKENGQNFLLINGNSVEIPEVVYAPPRSGTNEKERNDEDLFVGYGRYINNFIFFYCPVDSVIVKHYMECYGTKKDIDSDLKLKKYHTNSYHIDAATWHLQIENDFGLKRIHKHQ